MSVTYSDIPQGEPGWYEARAGLLTASVAKTMMGKDGVTLEKLIRNLAADRAYGHDPSHQSYSNAAMERGTCLEPFARSAFLFETDFTGYEVGLAKNTDYPGAGASMDGLVGPDMKLGLEIKCPVDRGTVIKYADEDRLPLEYRHQVVFQMMICELRAVYFWAWHPECKPFMLLVERDEDAILEMAERYREINARIDIAAERERNR